VLQSSLIKEISSQDLEGGGTRNDERCLGRVARRISGIRIIEKEEILSVIHATFSSHAWMT
jgi:hypothetical protein